MKLVLKVPWALSTLRSTGDSDRCSLHVGPGSVLSRRLALSGLSLRLVRTSVSGEM